MQATTPPIVAAGSALMLALMLTGCAQQTSQWYRGNTHTHTYWSDGDAAPEHAVGWYADNGYDFLVLSDHNIFQDHEKWFPITEEGNRPLSPEHVEALRARFGPGWVETRDSEAGPQMRLKTLDELRDAFDSDGFILISGEEVTTGFENAPVHINAMNIASVIAPQSGDSVADTMQRNIDAIIEHGREHDRPVLAHINHPNFGWGITARDLASLRGERFFEVYNGHRSVRNEGDIYHPSLEKMWDTALTIRILEGAETLFGVATDDAHNHHDADGTSVPGRGWIMVKSTALDAPSVIDSMNRGDFYATSGVAIDRIETTPEALTITITEEPGITYRTVFVGTRTNDEGSLGQIGEVLATTDTNPAVYRFAGNEFYVRARVVSSRLHPRPYREGDHETAWVQPHTP